MRSTKHKTTEPDTAKEDLDAPVETVTAVFHDDGTLTVDGQAVGTHEPRMLRKKYGWQHPVTEQLLAAGYRPASSWTRGLGQLDDDGDVLVEPDDFFTMQVRPPAALV